MIRHPGRLHKRRPRDILTRDDADPRPAAGRLRHLAAGLHRGGSARRAQARRRARRRVAREQRELCHGRSVHEERRARRAGAVRRRSAGRATRPDAGGRGGRPGRERLPRPGGAGMIHPDVATLLAVLTTDAGAEPAQLAPLLRRVADRTFNAISVDGDTSTNDTALLLANGTAGVEPARDGALWKLFEEAVQQVARHLALAVVTDGEGASKLLEIHVVGAASETAAREVGRAVARSVLVKTALYGADPNWGRVLAAAGAAGVALNTDRLTLQASGGDGGSGAWLTLATGGATAHPDPGQARAIFQQKTVRLRLDLGIGRAEAVVWTCDLTPDYVRINADYTS